MQPEMKLENIGRSLYLCKINKNMREYHCAIPQNCDICTKII